MREAEAVEYFASLLAKHGPDPSDYRTMVETLDSLHQTHFVVRDGASVRTSDTSSWEQLLSANRRVFKTTATMQGFAAAKPHGYAGDFEIIERIYNESVSQRPDLYKWDEFFHSGQASNSVRNRASVLKEIISEQNPKSLLSVGCGPGLDMAWAIESNSAIRHVAFLDNDDKAISRCKYNTYHLAENVTHVAYHHKNALRFKANTKYDIIWSSGLFDYLSDKVAIYLLKRLREISNTNGVVAFGNFDNNNASRSYMELVGSWFLIHRSANDLTRIALEAGYDRRNVEIRMDQEGLNIFAVARN